MKTKNRKKLALLLRPYIKANSLVSKMFRAMYPYNSYCERCGLPWSLCNSKAVDYSEHSGTFATCDYCFEHSTLEELKTYYTNVYKMQESSLRGTSYKMDHTLEHLLKCVERDYLSLHGA